MDRIFRLITAILAFPILFIFYLILRLLYNIVIVILEYILMIFSIFTFDFNEAFKRFLTIILILISIIFDMTIGLFVSFITALSSSIEIYNSEFKFIRYLNSIFKKDDNDGVYNNSRQFYKEDKRNIKKEHEHDYDFEEHEVDYNEEDENEKNYRSEYRSDDSNLHSSSVVEINSEYNKVVSYKDLFQKDIVEVKIIGSQYPIQCMFVSLSDNNLKLLLKQPLDESYYYKTINIDNLEYVKLIEPNNDFIFSLLSDGTYELEKYNGDDKDVVIASRYKGINITSIGEDAFEYRDNLDSIILPDTIKEIKQFAFSNCENLKEVYIPINVLTIGENAFSGCSSLTIFCEVHFQPESWENDWNPDNRPVVWGYVPK